MEKAREEITLVTGATGFIGNNIVRALLRRGKRVRCFVRDREKAERVLGGLPVEYRYGSVTDRKDIEGALEGDFDFVVIHAAGLVSIGKALRERMREVNVTGTKTVTDVCVERGVKKFVFLSSVHAVDEPPRGRPILETECFDLERIKGDYAKTKAESTAYVFDAAKNRGLNAVILHPSGVIGPYDFGSTYLTKLILDYAAGRIPAGVRGGYNFVDVRDVAEAAIAAAEGEAKGRCFLLTGHYASVSEILARLHAELKGRNIRHMLPMWAAKAALPFLTAYARVRGAEPLYNRYSLYTLSSNSDFVNDRAREELGFSPRPIAQSIRDTVDFLRAQGRLPAGRRDNH